MKKQEFLDKIKDGISSLPKNDIGRYVQYYSEMIDDRIEDGTEEEIAVAAVGSADEIINEILLEKNASSYQVRPPFSKRVNTFFTHNKVIKYILFAVITIPLWIAGIAASAITAEIVLFVFALSLAAAVSCVGGIVAGIVMIIDGATVLQSVFVIGAGLVCGGLAIPVFLLAQFILRWVIKLFKFLLPRIKEFVKSKKEELL